MSRRKNHETRRAVAALLSLYAVGRDNAKKAIFFQNKLLADYGMDMGLKSIAKALGEHPRAGFIDGKRGGYYLITTKAEADRTAAALEKRAKACQERAEKLRTLYL